MKVASQQLQSDPDVGHSCTGLTREDVLALTVKREMYLHSRDSKQPPSALHTEIHSSIGRRANEIGVSPQSVRNRFVSEQTARRAVAYRRAAKVPSIGDWRDVLRLYATTERGAGGDNGDAFFEGERWVLAHGENPDWILFMSDAELDVIQIAKFLVCDGTFDKTPKDFGAQIYSFHTEYEGEALIVGFSLMARRTTGAYTEIFNAIRTRLIVRHGGATHRLETLLMDYEKAAMKAASTVFGQDDVEVRGCLFHRSQAIQKQAGKYGLMDAYKRDKQTRSGVWRFIRQLVATAMLPAYEISDFIERYLREIPANIQEESEREACTRLLQYHDREWMAVNAAAAANDEDDDALPPDYVERWNHFHNRGHRTTNMAEGYHNRLNHTLRRGNKLRTFVPAMQQENGKVLTRILQLDDGRPPKPKKPKYIQLHTRIGQQQDELAQLLPQAVSREEQFDLMLLYVDRMKYMLGGADMAADGE